MSEKIMTFADIQRAGELLLEFFGWLAQKWEEIKAAIIRFSSSFGNWLRSLYPNRRVMYLSKHARTARVRKKNIRKFNKWLWSITNSSRNDSHGGGVHAAR